MTAERRSGHLAFSIRNQRDYTRNFIFNIWNCGQPRSCLLYTEVKQLFNSFEFHSDWLISFHYQHEGNGYPSTINTKVLGDVLPPSARRYWVMFSTFFVIRMTTALSLMWFWKMFYNHVKILRSNYSSIISQWSETVKGGDSVTGTIKSVSI